MRLFRTFFILFFFVSCQGYNLYEDGLHPDSVDSIQDDYYVDQDLAIYFATHQGDKRDAGILNCKPLVRDTDTLCYAVNYKSGGWDLISSDMRTMPLIMTSDEGEFPSLDEMPDGMRVVLDLQLSDLQAIRQLEASDSSSLVFWNKIRSTHKHGFRKKCLTRTIDVNQTEYNGDSIWCKHNYLEGGYEYRDEIPHLILTKWGQESPWNDHYPVVSTYPVTQRAYTGCVAVAIGQILYYCHFNINKPTGLYHDVSFYGIDTNTRLGYFTRSSFTDPSGRWDHMPLTGMSDTTSFVSDLLADIGCRVGMKYYPDGSYTDDLLTSYISSFGLSCSTSCYSFSTVRESLLNGMPVLVGAFPSPIPTIGHAFIIDGYRRKVSTYHNWYYFERVPYDDDLWEEYNASDDDYISDEYFAIEYPDAVPGVLYDEYWESPVYEQLTLNWGYDGNQDNVWVYSYPSSWKYNNIAYQYLITIIYGFN